MRRLSVSRVTEAQEEEGPEPADDACVISCAADAAAARCALRAAAASPPVAGRSHRSNQVSAPEYVIVYSEVAGEARLAAAVAASLKRMGGACARKRERKRRKPAGGRRPPAPAAGLSGGLRGPSSTSSALSYLLLTQDCRSHTPARPRPRLHSSVAPFPRAAMTKGDRMAMGAAISVATFDIDNEHGKAALKVRNTIPLLHRRADGAPMRCS